MALAWQVELSPDVTVSTDGTHCRIGGVVSVTVKIADIEFVWTESPGVLLDATGQLALRFRDRPGTLASIQMRRSQADRVRAMLESTGPSVH